MSSHIITYVYRCRGTGAYANKIKGVFDRYRNQLDIYSDILPDGKKPHHGPCGVELRFS